MAIAGDEWNGELTQFLDRLPARPCLAPPPPSFCSVCGSINGPAASVCRFYPLRHERERGQTFIEQSSHKRPDSFELDIDFEQEDEGVDESGSESGGESRGEGSGGLSAGVSVGGKSAVGRGARRNVVEEDAGSDDQEGSDMFEFIRPASTVAVRGNIKEVPPANAERPDEVEVEVYDAEVIEVIEEPEKRPAPKAVHRKAPPAAIPSRAPARAPARAPERNVEDLARMVKEDKKLYRKEVRKEERREERKEEKQEERKEERKEEQKEQKNAQKLEKNAKDMSALEAPMKPVQRARVPEPVLAPPIAPVPPPAPDKMVLSKEEEESLEREIEEELSKAGLHKDLEEPKPTSQIMSREPETEIVPDNSMPKEMVIAPIYSQPILRIIPTEAEKPQAYDGQPLPPPPPGYERPLPPRLEKMPIENSSPTREDATPATTIQPISSIPEKSMAEPINPVTPPVNIATSQQPTSAPPKDAPLVLGQRRTGGLYGIFQKKQKEPQTVEKKEVDEELAKRLKKTDK